MLPLTYYFLRLEGLPRQVAAHALQQKDGAYLSPHGRVAAMARAAAFRSKASAELCRDLWMERLQRRWGTSLVIGLESSTGGGAMRQECLDGPAILLARARSGLFAANVAFPEGALQRAREDLARLDKQAESGLAQQSA